MGNFKIDHTGKKVGLLTIIGYAWRDTGGARWSARCECGKERIIASSSFPKLEKSKTCVCHTVRPKRVHGLKPAAKSCRKCEKPIPKGRYFHCYQCVPGDKELSYTEADWGYAYHG